MKLTAKQLFQSFAAFAGLVAQRISNPRLSYNLSKTWKQFQAEAESLREQESAIYREFGATETAMANGAKGLSVDLESLSEERRTAFQEQIEELQKIPIEIWGHLLTLAEIEKAKLELSPNDFLLLEWLIADEAESSPEPATEKAQTQTA